MLAEFFPHLQCDAVFKDDDRVTVSSQEQEAVEQRCRSLFKEAAAEFAAKEAGSEPRLHRSAHLTYLLHGLMDALHPRFQALDASRPWLCYWITHALRLLDSPIPSDSADYSQRIVAFLKTCVAPGGGYGGGPGQSPHLATTYAAVMALVNVGTPEAYDSIDRPALAAFLKRMHLPDGSLRLHEDGEVDIRGVYLAVAVASLANLDLDALFERTPQWLISCQSYEGGFGGAPGCEAHGGYTYCGLAALVLLGHPRLVHLDSLGRWLANRQGAVEGGFTGRANKLVDGCYSFWQAACFPIIESLVADADLRVRFERRALQSYVLVCCQAPGGGLVDKPGKNADFYHTCYVLSGLSMAQHAAHDHPPYVLGHADNRLAKTHPLLNVRVDLAERARRHFSELPRCP